MISKKAALAGF